MILGPSTRYNDGEFHTANEQLLKNILDLTRFTFHLGHDWIDSGIKEPLEALIKEELEIFRSYSNLKIIKPIPEHLLAMKVLDARAEPAKDFVDAYLLCRELAIKTREELFEILKEYIPMSLIGERQRQFILYLGEDLVYDWK